LHLKQGKRQKNNDETGTSSIAYNLTVKDFGKQAAAATGEGFLALQTQAYQLQASSPYSTAQAVLHQSN